MKLIGADGISLAQKLTLKEARINTGYSVEEVSHKSNISVENIIQYEMNASEAYADEFLMLCSLYGVGYHHIHSGAAQDVYTAKICNKKVGFSDISPIVHAKWKLAELGQYVETDDMFTRQDISNAIRDLFSELHEYESTILTPILSGYDKGGKAV